MHKSLKELADLVSGELVGDGEIHITGAADIADAQEGDIVFAENSKHVEAALRSRAAAIIANAKADCGGKALIGVENPRYAFAKVLEAFAPSKPRTIGIDPSSLVGSGTVIGDNPSIGPNVYIGQNASIGENVRIYPFAFIGDDVTLGADCVVYPFVVLDDGVSIGNRVVIHSGSVIGGDGFGYTRVGDVHYKIPQIGTVIIGDDVEIGANAAIDRARTGATTIGSGTKIDNLVQIGHNTRVGENCVIVSQVGLSGSVTVGDRAVLAGQTGVTDHASIGADSVCCGRAGVIGDIDAGAFVSGYPARAHREQMKILAVQMKLPDLMRTVRGLEKRLKELEDRLG